MKKISSGQPWLLLFCILSIAVTSTANAQNRYLSNVQVQPALVDTDRGEFATISWQTHNSGRLDLLICDMDGMVVRRLMDQVRKNAGTHSVLWDGRDDQGQILPSGAYFPFIRLITVRQSAEIYDPTQGRWGGRLPVQDLSYDPDQRQITYTLEKPALCLLRIGIKEGGPSYGTLLHWVPRPAGNHSEPWDGKDKQGLAFVYDRDKFDIVFDTLALPSNTLLLKGSQAIYTQPDPGTERMAIHPPTGKEVYLHSLHPRHFCQDPKLDVAVLEGLEIGKNAVPVSKGAFLRFSVTAADPAQAENLLIEGCEVYAFVDGVFQQEIKATELPAAIDISIKTSPPGTHIITFNLRSMEDHVGSYSLKIIK